MMTDFDYLRVAYRYAQEHSTDPSIQNGAILVKDNVVFAYGTNHFPKGILENKERWQRPLKYSFVEHAERDVIYEAARKGISTQGATMYCPWFACTDCARAIILAGIIRVVGHKSPMNWYEAKARQDSKRADWRKTIEIALEMFGEAGVKYEYLEGKIGGVKIRFNGEIKNP